MAGVEKPKELQRAQSAEECRRIVNEPAITYARIFAETNGRGEREQKERAEIVAHYGERKARSIVALCWFLQWGSVGGNTVNSIIFGKFGGNTKNSVFKSMFTLYYTPLFGVIHVMNQGLLFLPRVPPALSSGIGVVLTIVGGSFIAPVGILGIMARKTGTLLRKRKRSKQFNSS